VLHAFLSYNGEGESCRFPMIEHWHTLFEAYSELLQSVAVVVVKWISQTPLVVCVCFCDGIINATTTTTTTTKTATSVCPLSVERLSVVHRASVRRLWI
jgi:hypothetical protein